MNLREAVAIAKRQVSDLYAPDIPQDMRLEEFLYDDHLMVWSLTIGFSDPPGSDDSEPRYKIVRVAEGNKSVLSVRDR